MCMRYKYIRYQSGAASLARWQKYYTSTPNTRIRVKQVAAVFWKKISPPSNEEWIIILLLLLIYILVLKVIIYCFRYYNMPRMQMVFFVLFLCWFSAGSICNIQLLLQLQLSELSLYYLFFIIFCFKHKYIFLSIENRDD